MRCRVCTNEKQSEIEKACKTSSVADVAERYGVNENALVRHLATHAPARASRKVAKSAAKPPRAASTRTLPPPAPSPAPPPRREQRAELQELDDEDLEEAPATSRSPTPPPTARAALDEILAEIKTLMASVNARRAYRGPDGEQAFEDVPFADKAAAIRAALQATRLLASLTGELGASEATVASSPYFKRMLQVILEAVRGPKFGEARQAILEALEREERGGAVREDQAA